MKRFILILILVFCFLIGKANRINIAGILSHQNNTEEEINKVDKLNKLAFDNLFIKKDTALILSHEAILLAANIPYPEGKSLGHHNIGIIHYLTGEFDSAISEYEKAISIREVSGKKKDLANSLSNLALVYIKMAEYEKAIEYNFRALSIRELIRDSVGLSKSLNNIGEAFYHYHKPDLALHFYKKSLVLKQKLGYPKDIASTLNNIGLIYFDFCQLEKKCEMLDSAELMFSKALKIRKEINDYHGITQTNTNLANLLATKKNIHAALARYVDNYTLQEKFGDKNGMALSLYNQAVLYFQITDFENAESIYFEALRIAQGNSPEIIKDVYFGLSKLFSATNQFDKAYQYQSRYLSLKDSLFNLESNKAIAEIQTKYELVNSRNELLLKTDEIRRLEMKRKNIIMSMSAIIAVLFLVVALYFFIAFKNKRKINDVLRNQSNELKVSRKTILDSIRYAKTIQNSLLPPIENFVYEFKNSFVIFRPKDIVSGDFLWYKKIGSKIIICAIDCTGHGVPGAFMSIVGNNILNEIILDNKISAPDKILFELDNRIKTVMEKKKNAGRIIDGMDMAVCVIEKDTLNFAGARMPIVLYKNGKIQLLHGEKYTIGEFPDEAKIIVNTVKMNNGEELFLFSDGYYDQFGAIINEPLKINQFLELLSEISEMEPDNQKRYLEDYLDDWKGEREQTDDILLLGYKF